MTCGAEQVQNAIGKIKDLQIPNLLSPVGDLPAIAEVLQASTFKDVFGFLWNISLFYLDVSRNQVTFMFAIVFL